LECGHSGIYNDFSTSQRKFNTISSLVWMCRVYTCSPNSSFDVQGVPPFFIRTFLKMPKSWTVRHSVSPAFGQSGTGMKNNTDAGMPMQVASAVMPIPSYA
jgi:hypothetical protein